MSKTQLGIVGAAVLAIAGAAVLGRSASSGASEPQDAVRGVAPRAAGVPRLVDLGAGKCIPCKAMAPILEQLRRDYAGKLQVDFIDAWQDRAAAEPYRIGMIPTQIFYAADGRELSRHEGFMSREEILGRWKAHGVVFE
jgi:thioredoxin 1